jgi:hypothetical protein
LLFLPTPTPTHKESKEIHSRRAAKPLILSYFLLFS